MSIDTATSRLEPVPTPGWRNRRALWSLGLVVVALAVASLAWVWRHPDQSFDGGYGMRVEREVGEPVWTSLVHPGAPGVDQVTISHFEPRIATDGAEVELEYLICELNPGALSRDGVTAFGYGLHARHVDRYCTRTWPAEGATFSLRSEPRQELLVGITPTRAGRTVIHGHHMSYTVGWQVGSEELEVETRVVSRTAGRSGPEPTAPNAAGAAVGWD